MENNTKIKDKFIIADPKDNVATARVEVKADTVLIVDDGSKIIIRELIPFGHKVALIDVNKDEGIVKYGQRIGIATKDIAVGELVHVKNLSGERGMAR
jgi:altronate dehydratase small subunit